MPKGVYARVQRENPPRNRGGGYKSTGYRQHGLAILLQLVQALVLDGMHRVQVDNGESAFAKVYQQCTCNTICLIYPGEDMAADKIPICACQAVSNEAVLQECQKLNLLSCIPSPVGIEFQRVALWQYHSVQANFAKFESQQSASSQERKIPRAGYVTKNAKNLARQREMNDTKPLRRFQTSRRQEDTGPEISEFAWDDDDNTGSHATTDDQEGILQGSNDAVTSGQRIAFIEHLGECFDNEMPPHIKKTESEIWFCLPTTVPRFVEIPNGAGSLQTKVVYDYISEKVIFIQFSTTGKFVCSKCHQTGKINFPKSIPNSKYVDMIEEHSNPCQCCSAFLDYIRQIYPTLQYADDSSVLEYVMNHSGPYTGHIWFMYDCYCECIQLLYAKKHTNTCSLLLIFLVAVQTAKLSTIPNHTQQSHFPPRSMKLTNTLCAACINLANEGGNSTNESLSGIKTGNNPLFCIYQVFC